MKEDIKLKNYEEVQDRYCLTEDNLKREVLLFKSNYCIHRACSFCDYYVDGTYDEEKMIKVAKEILPKLTGEVKVLEILNSGSFFEIPKSVLDLIVKRVKELKYDTILFESHYHYKDRIKEVNEIFKGLKVIAKTGIETFDYDFRENILNKGFTNALTPEDVSKYFKGINLLIGIKGQTIEMIEKDLEIGLELFDIITVNIFTKNAKNIEIDEELIKEFYNKFGHLRSNKKILLYDHKNGIGLG